MGGTCEKDTDASLKPPTTEDDVSPEERAPPKARPDLSESDESATSRCHEILAAVSQQEFITAEVLKAYFELPVRLHDAIWSHYCPAEASGLARDVFMQLLRDSCSRRARSGGFLFNIYHIEAGIVGGAELRAMLEDELELAKAAMADLGRERLGGPKSEGRVFSAFVNKVPAAGLNENQFATWATRELPEMGALLSAWLMGKVRRCEDELKQQMGAAGESEEASEAQGAVLEIEALANYMPLTEGQSGVIDSEALWGLGRIWPKGQQAALKRLYSTDDDGCNLIMMARAIAGYRGPTLIVLRDMKGRVFGGFAQHEWRDTGQFVADPDSFLFRIDEGLAKFGAHGARNNLLLATYGNKKGFGMGGTTKTGRLFVDSGLREGTHQLHLVKGRIVRHTYLVLATNSLPELCVAGEWRNECGSYEKDPHDAERYAETKVDIWALEVWGCGGHAAEEARNRHLRGREVERQKRIKVIIAAVDVECSHIGKNICFRLTRR